MSDLQEIADRWAQRHSCGQCAIAEDAILGALEEATASLRQQIEELGRVKAMIAYGHSPSTPNDGAEAMVEHLTCECKDLQARVSTITAENLKLRSALSELHAIVKGECPSLLDEDSGGSANLDIEIEGLLHP